MARGFWVPLLGVVLATAAQAQQGSYLYNCRTAAGTNYQSTQPCNVAGGTSTGRPIYYPPVPEPRRYEPPPPSVGAAPNHVRYMSAECSSLHDAIRTGPARGLTSATLSEMRSNYQSRCAEDESQARRRVWDEMREKQVAKREEQVASQRASERSALQAQQCGESKRILVAKRQRTDLTEGEKAELARFEENYRARCS